MSDSLDLSAILCSRLCHDLVNPVGAVANGVEMLGDEADPDMQEQVLALLDKSARQVSHKLQFFRLAFGAAGGMGATIAMSQIRAAAEPFVSDSKAALDWQPELSEITKDGAKVLLNLVLVAAESLLRGGSVTVSATARSGDIDIQVTAAGERVLLVESVRNALSGEIDLAELDPKAAPAYLARTIAAEVGGQVGWKDGDGQLTLTASLP